MAVERSGHVWLRSVVTIVYLIGRDRFDCFQSALFCLFRELEAKRRYLWSRICYAISSIFSLIIIQVEIIHSSFCGTFSGYNIN